MSTTPTFRAARKDHSAEPLTFYVEGEAEPFRVPRPLPAVPLLDMAAEAEDGDVAGALAGFLRFLRGCLPEHEWPRFRDAVTRARMGADDLLPIVQWLVEEAVGRPTTPPSSWADSPSSGGVRPNAELAGTGVGAPWTSPPAS